MAGPQIWKKSIRSRDWCKKIRLAQSFAITQQSTISFQSLWNLLKIFSSWVGKVAWRSVWLDKNCEFFTNSQILSQYNSFCISLYYAFHQQCLEKSVRISGHLIILCIRNQAHYHGPSHYSLENWQVPKHCSRTHGTIHNDVACW